MSTQVHNREGARRQHRTIALFTAIQCWIRDLDGVVFEKAELQRLLGLKVVKPGRVRWLIEDITPWFPHIKNMYFSKWFGSLWVNRKDFLKDFPSETLSTSKRIEAMRLYRFGVFKLWNEVDDSTVEDMFGPFFTDKGFANFDERFLTSYLTLLSQGQVSVNSISALTSGMHLRSV
jgi:hypothetical protein